MCVIIDRPAGVPIAERYLKTALNDNPDGWGWMYAEDNEIVCDWGMKDDEFFESYKAIPEAAHATLHFRWTTHGLTNELNCHPFLFNGDEYAVVHNGVLGSVKIKYQELSDTYHFANGELSEAFILYGHAYGGKQHKRLRKYLEHVVGTYNKLVILRKDGERMFLNRKAGVTHEGLWLSNSGPLTAPASEHSKWSRRYHKSGGHGTWQGWDEERSDDVEGVGYYGGYSGGAFSPSKKETSQDVKAGDSSVTQEPNTVYAKGYSGRMRYDKEQRKLVPIGDPKPNIGTPPQVPKDEAALDVAAKLEEQAEANPRLVSAAVTAALATANPVDADYAYRLAEAEDKVSKAEARARCKALEDDETERLLIEHYAKRNDEQEEEEAAAAEEEENTVAFVTGDRTEYGGL